MNPLNFLRFVAVSIFSLIISIALNQCLGKIVSSVPEDLKDMSQASVDLKQLENIMKYVDG